MWICTRIRICNQKCRWGSTKQVKKVDFLRGTSDRMELCVSLKPKLYGTWMRGAILKRWERKEDKTKKYFVDFNAF